MTVPLTLTYFNIPPENIKNRTFSDDFRERRSGALVENGLRC